MNRSSDADILAKAKEYTRYADGSDAQLMQKAYVAGYKAAMADLAQSLAPALDVLKDGET